MFSINKCLLQLFGVNGQDGLLALVLAVPDISSVDASVIVKLTIAESQHHTVTSRYTTFAKETVMRPSHATTNHVVQMVGAKIFSYWYVFVIFLFIETIMMNEYFY